MEAPILILDEPTSSLDPETETLLDGSTRLLMKGKTVITIAHRLNTVFHADRIIVLDQGSIIETGTHRELLAQNGAYSRMVNAGDGTAAQGEAGRRKKEGRGKKVVGEEDIKAGPRGTGDLVPALQSAQWKSADQPSILLRLFSFLQGSWSLVGLSALLGAFTIGASVALMGTSAWLISTAALHPSIADLGVSIVGVRFFGISRGVFRYLERLVSHNVTFRLLARLRTWFYEKLEPLAPARLMEQRAGDLLARIIGDVETLENFYVRIVSPSLTAILVGLVTVLYLASHHPMLGLSLTGFFLTLGLLLPLLAQALSRRPATELVRQHADLQTRLVDNIQGLADILAFDRARDQLRRIALIAGDYGRSQKRMARLTGMQAGPSVLLTNLGMWTVLSLSIPMVSSGELGGVMLAPLTLLDPGLL